MMEVEKGRVGQYFFFVGLIMLIIFFSMDPSAPGVFGFLVCGISSVGLGLYLIRRDWKRPQPSGRFRLLRRLRRRPQDENTAEPKNNV